MPKLHELLAVEGQLKGQAQATRKELVATFGKKRHLFEKKVVTYQPLADGSQAEVEQQSEINSTIPQELGWITALWKQAIDVSYQVAEANTSARADVVLENGTLLLSQVPATALLELEKRAAEIQELVSAIPTNDPAKSFVLDPDSGDGIYKAREVRKKRTKKVQQPIVLLQPTVEHPGKAELISVDVEVGTVTEQEWSGMLTVKQKGDMLERAEGLRRAVKAARMRANDTTLEGKLLLEATCGAKLLGYVFGL